MRFKCIAGRNTVDGRNPAPVDTVNIQHFFCGFIHPRWCRISSDVSCFDFQYASDV